MTADGLFRHPVELLKLHGMGNDFLVLVDRGDRWPIGAEAARALCDRHRGLGADGLIRARVAPSGPGEGSAVAAMELLNADGSPAETSGNGLRCLALALAVSGVVPGQGHSFTIGTAVGDRSARVGPLGDDGAARVTVGMGRAELGPEISVAGRRARLVDLGNPHAVVLVEDPDAVDLETEGPAEEARHAGGINVSYVAVESRRRVRIRTWERGAGATLACGSGSCAAVAALADWDLVDGQPAEVAVLNPGGAVEVAVAAGDVVLTGPAQLVARVEVEGRWLGSTGRVRAEVAG